jgi:hypothetical protein
MSADLYGTDFLEWTRSQAEALRAGQYSKLDQERLAEEVEDLGLSQLSAKESYVLRILEHLLLIEFIGPAQTIPHWRVEIAAFRGSLKRRLSPTMRKTVQDELDELYADALMQVRARAAAYGRSVELPDLRRYDWDDVLGRADGLWSPEPLYGSQV